METIISTSGLTKQYGSSIVLSDLSLEIKKGEVFGYLGPNGAGKTTTIRLLLGLIKPTAGEAKIFGYDCQKEKLNVHKHVAYIPGEATLWPNLTGKQTLHLFGNVHGEVDYEYMQELIHRFQFDPNKKVRSYSKGNKQKINLIAAFATRADLLIMDEPTSGLDPLMEQVFRECVMEAKQRGQTIFLSSHILEEVQALCDRIAILREGHLVEIGTLEQMRHLSSLRVDATFSSAPPDLSGIQGIQDLKVGSDRVSCTIRGDIAPLLQVISQAHPISFLCTEPSLEELFITIYGRHKEDNI